MEQHIKTDPDDPEYTTLTTVVDEEILGKIEPVDFDGLDVVQLAHDLPDGTTIVNRCIVNYNDVIIREDGSAITIQEYCKTKSPQQEGELKNDDGDYFTVVKGESPHGGAERSNGDEPLFGCGQKGKLMSDDSDYFTVVKGESPHRGAERSNGDDPLFGCGQEGELKSDDSDYFTVVKGESPHGGAERSNADDPLFGCGQEGELKSDDGDYFTVVKDESAHGGAERSNADDPLFGCGQEVELKSDDSDYFTVVKDESPHGGAERSNGDDQLFGGVPLCGSPKQYFCPKCCNSFKAAGPMKLHIRACLKKREKESEEERTCAICDKVLHSVAYMKEHLKRHASGFGTRRCTQCYRHFTDETKWKAHLETHEKQDKLNAEADALSVQFGKKKVVKEFTCSFCKMKFKVAFDQGRENRRYACDECRTKYSKAEQLKQRKETMSVQREFNCERCGRKFAFEGFLQRHRRNCDGTIKRRRDLNGMK